MKHKGYIIREILNDDNDYEKMNELYTYGKSLYLNSIEQLYQNMKINRYLDEYILPNKPHLVSKEFIDEIKSIALRDYETNKIKKLNSNSSLNIRIYTDDITFNQHYLLIDLINLKINFEFNQCIKSVHSFKIKPIESGYQIILEVIVDLKDQNIKYYYDELVVNNQLKQARILTDDILICLMGRKGIVGSQTLFIENRTREGRNYDSYETLVEEQKLHNYSRKYLVLNLMSKLIK